MKRRQRRGSGVFVKIAIMKEVPLSQVFGHVLAAWDCGGYEWYRSVKYSQKGDALAFDDEEAGVKPGDLLCTVTMYSPDDEEKRIKVRVTPNKLRKALEACLRKGRNYATEAMRIIDDSSQCDMNTADVVMQVLAYGDCVYG